MKKIISITMSITLMSITLLPSFVPSAKASTTKNYGDVTLSSNGSTDRNHFEDLWDLNACDMTLSFTYDGNGLDDSSGAHAWSEIGIREEGYGDFNPTWMVEGAGIWMSTDYDWSEGTFDPDLVGFPTLDLDDKIILQKGGGMGESAYNLPSSPPNPWANHRIWWDRDGVDPWQNDETANTGGLYDVVMTLKATGATTGEAYLNINGLNQGFETDGNWGTIELTPAGMTFSGDMSKMQVFYGLFGYGATHEVEFNNIQTTGCKIGITPDKVTGGAGDIVAGGAHFNLAVNAIHTGKGDLKGKIQYSREEQGTYPALNMHAETACVGATEDGSVAVVAGPARSQFDPAGYLTEGSWLIASIKESGTGSGDRVRVYKTNQAMAEFMCSHPSEETSFPGLVLDGEFKISI